MRIVHVCVTEAFAGTERYVADVAGEQARLGHDVTIVSGGRLAAAQPGVRTRPGGTMPAALRTLWKLSADVVHAHLTCGETCAVLTRPAHRAAVVATRHIAAPRGSSPAGKVLRRLIESGLRREIAISHFVADAIGRPAIVLHNGVQSQPERQAPKGTTVLLAQRLEREKSSDVALRAWLASDLPGRGWRLEVAGDGAEREPLERLVAAHSSGDSVSFLGRVDDVRERLREAAALLAPAVAEPLGLSVLEAMANGTPVIAAAGGGHLETLPDDYPWLFAAGDVDDATSVLSELTTQEGLWQRLGGELQRRQREHFTVEHHVAALEDIYREACAR